jgi:diguanylate cyclase (GGDEF)-like protein
VNSQPRTQIGLADLEVTSMEDTLVTMPQRPVAANRSACLVQIYPTGPGMGCRHALGSEPIVLGRDDDCDLRIDDPSVSRRHAKVQPGIDGHYAIDLKSTNGTYVNDRPATMHKLRDGDYVRVGNRIFRYLSGDNIETEYHEEIYRLTIIDGLTGIYNKRYFLEHLDRELARSARHRRPLSLVVFDVDRFKEINDRFGHLAGDHVLREVTACLKTVVRKEELFARFGGDEFMLILPETLAAGALEVAERLRQLTENHPFACDGTPSPVTVSVGVYTTDGSETLNADDMVKRADQLLYKAKNNGRNQVAS